MSQPFVEDFVARRRQVLHYLMSVLKAERDIGGSATEIARLKVLRAGAFLVLYNLVEATTRGALEAIHDKITSDGASFDSLNPALRREVVGMFRRLTSFDELHDSGNFSSAFVALALGMEVKFSGNIDAKLIRKIANTYGFSHQTERSRTRDGYDLLIIKTNRNSLAHGRKTFEEVGSDYTKSDLFLMSKRAIHYMNGIVRNIEIYLENRHYLLQGFGMSDDSLTDGPGECGRNGVSDQPAEFPETEPMVDRRELEVGREGLEDRPFPQ